MITLFNVSLKIKIRVYAHKPKSFKNAKFDILSNRILIKSLMQLNCDINLISLLFKNAKDDKDNKFNAGLT